MEAGSVDMAVEATASGGGGDTQNWADNVELEEEMEEPLVKPHRKRCKMSPAWKQTQSGHSLNPFAPDVEGRTEAVLCHAGSKITYHMSKWIYNLIQAQDSKLMKEKAKEFANAVQLIISEYHTTGMVCEANNISPVVPPEVMDELPH